MTSSLSKPAPEISAIARALRVAFIIEDGDGVHPLLDAAFHSAFGRHGGRQSLVVPVVSGAIPPAFIRWLRIFDPDIAFLVAADNDTVAAVVEQSCSPLLIKAVKRHPKEGERNTRPFRLDSPALTSLSWLPFLKVASGGFRGRPEIVLDCYPRWMDDGLITDNFGTLNGSFDRFPLHHELADIVKPLMLTPKDAPVDRWNLVVRGDELTSGYEALNALAQAGRVISLAYLSNIQSKHISFRSHDWTRSFCLIVGDAFADRVSCWNAGLLFDDARHQTYKTLRLPATVVNDATKIEQIKSFINSINWITGPGNRPHVTVRSSSIDKAQLTEFGRGIGGKGSWYNYTVEPIGSIEECCPPPPRERESDWIRVKPDERDVRMPLRHNTESALVPQPFQLKHAPLAHPVCSVGQWIVQYRIDRTTDHNHFANVRDSWALPQRNQLTRLFIARQEARITSEGLLAVPVDRTIERIEISEPQDRDFFYTLLHRPAVYAYPDVRHEKVHVVSYQDSRPSDKGRYLQGILGMFGSLDRAYEILTHAFWRRQFVKLGSPSDDQYPQVIQILKKRLRAQANRYVIEQEEQWEHLARTFVRQAASVRQPKYTVKLQTLVDEWQRDLAHAINLNKNLHEHRDAMLAEAPEELAASLEQLCREGVFHQGYEWLCPHCSHRNWTALSALRMALECQVCHRERTTPVDLKFDFRLNEFLATCIREHDTSSVIWALGKLQRRARPTSFIFAPQTELFKTWRHEQQERPDCEIDILCVIDGKVLIGEVKTSLAEIDRTTLDGLIGLASELDPDIVLIAAQEGEKAKLAQKLEILREKVRPGIDVEGFLGNDESNGIEHYLP